MTEAKHPARWSGPILDVLRTELAGAPWVHDPFAGTGERLGALCDELGVTFTGTELERPFISDHRISLGDSRDWRTYPGMLGGRQRFPYWIVTSPAYPNGMCDHFVSSGTCSACGGAGMIDCQPDEMVSCWCDCPKCDGTGRREVKRQTYRQALIEITGDPTYRMDPSNQGRYSVRAGKVAEAAYWLLAEEVVSCWDHAERAVVNVKDFYRTERKGAKPTRYPLGDRWVELMVRHGWAHGRTIQVPCPGNKRGANRERVDFEEVQVYVR